MKTKVYNTHVHPFAQKTILFESVVNSPLGEKNDLFMIDRKFNPESSTEHEILINVRTESWIWLNQIHNFEKFFRPLI